MIQRMLSHPPPLLPHPLPHPQSLPPPIPPPQQDRRIKIQIMLPHPPPLLLPHPQLLLHPQFVADKSLMLRCLHDFLVMLYTMCSGLSVFPVFWIKNKKSFLPIFYATCCLVLAFISRYSKIDNICQNTKLGVLELQTKNIGRLQAMDKSRWAINGRTFRTIADYEAGLRDKEKIDAIKKTLNRKNVEAVEDLYRRLQNGELVFETVLGRDFDDEIYELKEHYRRQRNESGKVQGKSGKRHKAGKDKNGRKNSAVSLEDCDEELRKEILRELARREKRRRIIAICCSLVAILSLGYFSVYNYFSARTQSSAGELAQLKSRGNYLNLPGTVHKTGDQETPDILEEYITIYNVNKSLIGWIEIADTKIEYPVMQTVDSEYYLTHNWKQEKDKNGSIFMDPLCDVLKPSTNLIIYGHHMRSGNMFGELDKYSSKEFYEKHKRIQFDTIYEKGTYEVMYVFRSRIFYEDEITFKYYQFIDALSEAEFNSAMEAMAEMSLYDTGVEASFGDQLLTLSTCDNSEEDGRFVVVAKRIQ